MCDAIQRKYFYWDPNFKTEKGLSLLDCYKKFGVTLVTTEKFYYKVIFLDSTKSLSKSWMLWLRDNLTDRNIPVVLYEEGKNLILEGDI